MVEATGRITLWGIEVFLAIAEERSISVAARRLGASASAVSQQLSNLEAGLGAGLVDRSARPLSLTPAGDLFRRRAQAIVGEAEQARAELARADLARLTRFRLGMIEDFDADVTPRLLAQMATSLTETRFLLETGASHRLTDQLDARALDVIVAAEIGAAADWMEVHPLLEEPFVAAVPRGTGTGLDSLANLPLILYTPRHYMGRQIAEHLARQNLTLAHRFEIDSYHAIMAMVASGAGWTILTPLGVLRALRFVDAVDIAPLPFAPLSRRITLSARKGVLADMPGDLAARLKPLLAELIVTPAVARYPFLEASLRLL
ncbi:LysR family transcriptional regulator [Maritimibacter sp. HL-12]|uniref:LysR family transcriptional regulator n=1 Tax=Maritimibacter sp. HL-12 TaxID=1162418 RepID=UPI000A0EFEA9|nr:LysR family transcriptional regulator [Maritimibacter sp. HL-12]SMH35107.1 DNA-binding transcriptional regulator, LysR family [Maritimibacter sp. HL-12]